MHKRSFSLLLIAIMVIQLSVPVGHCSDPRTDETFAKVRQQIYADERGGLPEDSLDTILWKLQSVPQFKARAIAAVKKYKMMRDAYQLYARSVEMVQDLDKHNWSDPNDRESFNGLLRADRQDWEKVSEAIRKYNNGVEEQYRIPILEWPFSEK